jgi:hypothetical protein
MSGPPETLSMVTVSPEATFSTGFSPASKNPQWQVSGLARKTWCCDIVKLPHDRPAILIATAAAVQAFPHFVIARSRKATRQSQFGREATGLLRSARNDNSFGRSRNDSPTPDAVPPIRGGK